MQGGGEEEEREATTAKDSHNVTEKRGMKKKTPALPDFPSFGMHPIYPVSVSVCACVACWQEGFQHINITLPHKETQASVWASSRPNKHRSSTLEVRGRAYTNGIPQEPALLLTDKWL